MMYRCILASIAFACGLTQAVAGQLVYQPMDLSRLSDQINLLSQDIDIAPSPAVSYVGVIYVTSSSQPTGESIQPGQKMTSLTHRGKIKVATLEIGYGNVNLVAMNNEQLPLSALIESIPVCSDGSGNIHRCRPNEKIVGYLREWNAAGHGNGEFSYALTSINYPNNTMSTSLYIQ